MVFVYTNLHLLSKKSKDYNKGENRTWNIIRDAFNPFEGAKVLKNTSLSLDEPDIKSILFIDGNDKNEAITIGAT